MVNRNFLWGGQSCLPTGFPARRADRRAAVRVIAALFAALAQAQQPPVIHIDAREVVVDVTVIDSKGAVVSSLTKDDFKITDEGKPREIVGFSVNSEYPEISAAPVTSPLHLPPKPGANGETASKPGHSTAIILDEVNTWAESAIPARQNVISLMKKVPADERIVGSPGTELEFAL